MKKNDYIDALKKVKRNQHSKLSAIQQVIEKALPPNSLHSLQKEDGSLGGMLYASKEQTQTILGGIFYDELESLHTRWCEEYTKIYLFLNGQQKQGLISSVFHKKQITDFDRDKVLAYNDDLANTTEDISKIIDKALMRITALLDSKFEA